MLRYGYLALVDVQTARTGAASLDNHFAYGRILTLHLNIEGGLIADIHNLGLITHIREYEFILRVLNLHGEVTHHISLCGADNTVVGVTLHHIGHHDRSHGIFHRT